MNKIKLANLPTPIQKLNNISENTGKNIYLKRDDYTGMELTGNKIRKLEYVLADALAKGANTIITAGGLQSNHCRATAAACAKLGLECHLVLKEKEVYHEEGNLFLDYMFGAKIHLISKDEDRNAYMEQLAQELEAEDKNTYLIPIGASNAVGSLGYQETYEEIIEQEKQMDTSFDTIVVTVGSGGTYAGLWLANHLLNKEKKILGFSVDASTEEFTRKVINIVKEMNTEVKDFDSIHINDRYIGEGYSIATSEEIEDYVKIAKQEGVLFDPCYTGKAFRGLLKEIQKGELDHAENILFIHTGGLYGWTQENREIALRIVKENQ